MNPQQALQLHDIHIPTDASIWPLALGWWLLILLALIALSLIFFTAKKYFYVKKHKNELRHEYLSLENKLKHTANKELITETNTLLRRFALAYYPEQSVASLSGDDWLRFLDKSSQTEHFSQGAGRILSEAPYTSGQLENYKKDEFIPLIRNWINKTIDTRVNKQTISFNQHKLIKKEGGCP